METLTLPERYEVESLLGAGAMGRVLLAHDKNLDKKVAIKILSSSFSSSEPKAIKRFQREAQATARLSHANIVEILDFGITENQFPYLVMVHVAGRSLSRLLSRRGRLDLETAISIFQQIASGMAHAHKNDVIHRDLKPSNILLKENDSGMSAKIIDFGIAKFKELQTDGRLTSTNAIVGSPQYMSPEQIDGALLDHRSDIYSFGCVMFECLAGHPPFGSETAIDTMRLHLNEPAPIVSFAAPELEIPEYLDEIIQRCLEKDPDDRFQSMDEILEAIETGIAAQSESESNSELAASEKGGREGSSKAPRMTVAAIALILVGIAAGTMLMPKEDPKPNSQQTRTTTTEDPKPSEATDLTSDFQDVVFPPPEVMSEADLRRLIENTPKKTPLDLREKKISNSMLEMIGNSHFNTLILDNGEIEDQTALSELKNFRRVSVANASITDKGVMALSECKELRILKLKGADFSAESMKALSNLPYLNELEIDEMPNVTPEKLEPLTKVKNLRLLRLLGADVEPDCVPTLCRMKNLKELDLRGTEIVQDHEQIKKIERELRPCEVRSGYGPKTFDEYMEQKEREAREAGRKTKI